jgi:hypothetical protein
MKTIEEIVEMINKEQENALRDMQYNNGKYQEEIKGYIDALKWVIGVK